MSSYLKRLREAKGWSQRKLAAEIGCSPGHVARMEVEEEFAPSEEMACALAKVLGGDPVVYRLAGGQVPPELRATMRQHPEAFVQLLRELKGQPEHAIFRVTRVVKDGKW